MIILLAVKRLSTCKAQPNTAYHLTACAHQGDLTYAQEFFVRRYCTWHTNFAWKVTHRMHVQLQHRNGTQELSIWFRS
jgi:hypothetical protein